MRIKVATLLVAAVSLGMAQGVYAADMPVKARLAPSVFAPNLSWTGWYAGVTAGWIDNQDGATETGRGVVNDGPGDRATNTAAAIATNQDFSSTDALWGLTLGINYQMNNFVFGIEGDLSYTRLGDLRRQTLPYGNIAYTGSVTTVSASGMDWFATLRARAGMLVLPATSCSATGGLAAGGVHASLNINGDYGVFDGTLHPYYWQSNASVKDTNYGWVIGGGVDIRCQQAGPSRENISTTIWVRLT